MIGLVLISLAEALDTRIRRSDEISERLGLPLLTRIPIPPRSLRKTGSLGMLDDEGGLQSEAYRKLRINLDFANLSIKARLIMLTSAIEQEGKSTTSQTSPIAFARAGRRVALVDLDLRRPPSTTSSAYGPAGADRRRPRPGQPRPGPVVDPVPRLRRGPRRRGRSTCSRQARCRPIRPT